MIHKVTIKTWYWASMANPFTRITFYKDFYCKTNMPPSSIATATIQKLGDILHMSVGFMFEL
jgi:hypothetical protein